MIIPCKDCLTLSMCRNRFEETYNIILNKTELEKEDVSDALLLSIQTCWEDCHFLHKFIFDPSTPKIDSRNLRKSINFFIGIGK